MRAWVAWTTMVALCSLSGSVARAQDARGVAIVVEDGGGPAAEQLARVLDVPTQRAANERAGCAVAPVVVAVGTVEGVVAVRCGDGVRLARGVEEAAVVASPYAAALVAAELIDLLAAEPPAQREVPRVAAPSGIAVAVHVELAAEASGSADGTALVVAPRAVFDVTLGRQRGAPSWAGIGAFVAPFGVRGYAVGDTEVRQLGYVRHVAGLRGMVGVGAPSAASAVLGVELGGALTFVDAHAEDGAAVGSDTRARFVAGFFGELRQPIGAGLGVALGIGVDFVPDPVRWLVHGIPVLYDGLVWVNATLGLTWDG